MQSSWRATRASLCSLSWSKTLVGQNIDAQAAIAATGFFDVNRGHGYLVALRIGLPPCQQSTRSGICPTRWVEQDRHGS